jgi:putative addiction module component (TIGR02574 family)
LELDGANVEFECSGMTLERVQEGAKLLSSRERAELLDWLWENLQPEGTSEVQERWAAEAEDRIDAVERGELPTVDGPAVMEQLRSSLGS